MSRLVGIFLSAFCVITFFAAAAPEAGADDAVFDEDSVWSYYFVARGDQRKNIGREARQWDAPVFGYPPADWYEPDFDDSGWGVSTAPFPEGSNRWGYGHRASGAGSILLRNRFRVTNPAAADLRLNVAYRGGVVVYLNGREIARQHLVEPGDEEAATDPDAGVFDLPAEEYPFEAWYTPDRDPIDWEVGDDVEGELREHLTRYRVRRIEDLELPADALRPGVNVLAIQINAAPQPDMRHFFREHGWGQVRRSWSRLGLVEARLDSRGVAAALEGAAHERGVFIGPMNPLQEIDTQSVAAMRHRPEAQLRLVGPRGGYASAPVAVLSETPLPAPRVHVGVLSSDAGHTLPADAVSVLYGSTHHRDKFGADDGHSTDTHHILSSRPSEPAKLHSAWIEVKIPRDAAPGLYSGQAVVRTQRAARSVPVELHVGRFRMPTPAETVGFLEMLHNPENTALRYEAELWSDKHFDLLGQVFDRLGSVGNDVLHIPLAMNNHLGTTQTMVRWRMQGGSYRPDLSVLERYLRLYDRRCGQPKVLGLYLWDVIMGGGRDDATAYVTVVDARGEVSREQAPWYGESGSEEFWKPAIDGVLEIVDDLGWDRDSVMIVGAHDRKPTAGTREFFADIAPGMKWASVSHARGYRPRDGELTVDGLEVGYHAYPWQADMRIPDRGIIGGWDGEFLQTTLARFHFHSFSGGGRIPATYRALVSNAISPNRSRRFRGVSRFQLDYWPVPRDGGGFRRLLNMSGWVNLMRNHEFLLAPGPDGPEPTVSFVQLREGAQETEARLAIETALADEELKASLDDDLLDEAYDVLAEHARLIRSGSMVWQGYVSLPWREHAERLFDTAGRLADQIR